MYITEFPIPVRIIVDCWECRMGGGSQRICLGGGVLCWVHTNWQLWSAWSVYSLRVMKEPWNGIDYWLRIKWREVPRDGCLALILEVSVSRSWVLGDSVSVHSCSWFTLNWLTGERERERERERGERVVRVFFSFNQYLRKVTTVFEGLMHSSLEFVVLAASIDDPEPDPDCTACVAWSMAVEWITALPQFWHI